MKKYYVGPLTGNTEISRYANDFYKLVLQDRGYILIDSGAKSIVEMLSIISSRDQVHIEISGQKKEMDLLALMLNARYKYVSITLHNPMQAKFRFYELKNSLLDKLSRIYDRNTAAAKYLRQVQSIYVLSRKGMEDMQRKYKIDNVSYLPYIVNQHDIERNLDIYSDVIDFDPNGGKKEIGQWLRLHKQLMDHDNQTEQIKNETYSYLIKHHSADAVRLQFKD